MTAVELSAITDEAAGEAAEFLHRELNPRVSAESWLALLQPPWATSAPNHGFQLRDGGKIVGVYAAVYSEREIAGTRLSVCNLAAFCVLDEYRMHSLRLVRALMKQKDYTFTDFSPSGNVVAMNERLGFQRLDGATRLVVNLPSLRHRGVRLTQDPTVLETTLRGRDADVYRDHRGAAAARHLLVRRGGEYAYLVFRADSRKRLRLFATPLYVGGSQALLESEWGSVRAHLLLRHRLTFTLAERRLLHFARGLGRQLQSPRPKMVRSENSSSQEIDYLYSELALVSW
jgi:hypothetical protein